MKQQFEQSWDAFTRFIRDSGQSLPTIDQCEMTYTNIFDQEEGWNSIGQFGNVFTMMAWPSTPAFLPAPKTLVARLTFDIPGIAGRLHAVVRHVLKREGPAQEALMLELTARGLPSRIDHEGLLSWFASAREAIVRGFTDLTTDAMHGIWEREQ